MFCFFTHYLFFIFKISRKAACFKKAVGDSVKNSFSHLSHTTLDKGKLWWTKITWNLFSMITTRINDIEGMPEMLGHGLETALFLWNGINISLELAKFFQHNLRATTKKENFQKMICSLSFTYSLCYCYCFILSKVTMKISKLGFMIKILKLVSGDSGLQFLCCDCRRMR